MNKNQKAGAYNAPAVKVAGVSVQRAFMTSGGIDNMVFGSSVNGDANDLFSSYFAN